MVFNSIRKAFNIISKDLAKKPKIEKPKISKNKLIALLKKHPIKKIMSKAVIVKEDYSKQKLLNLAIKNPNAKIFPVIDKNKNLVGTIHEDDLFIMQIPNDSYDQIGIELAIELHKKFFAKTANEIMRKQLEFCYDFEDILKVAHKFLKIDVNEMVVLNKQNKVVGVITQGNLLRYFSHKNSYTKKPTQKIKSTKQKKV